MANRTALRQPTPLGNAQTHRRDRFISSVRIDRGPTDLLARFFIAADAALAAAGVDLHVGTFEELVEVNRANRDSWLPLNPTFDPMNGLVDSASAFVLLGTDATGTVVATTALKLFDWQATTLKIEAESLRLFFADPATMAPDDTTCSVTAPSASIITGRVGYGGAQWVHPDFRKKRLPPILSRLIRALAYARWQVDLVCGISSLKLIGRGYTDRGGYVHMEPSIHFTNPALGLPAAGLAWITAAETLEDLRGFLVQLGGAEHTTTPSDLERQNEARVARRDSAA